MALSPGVTTRFLKRAEVCCICSAAISVQGQLDSCKHVFCLDCILKWADIENSCPLCKQRFSQVTPRWHRKCLALRKPRHQVHFKVERRSQETAAHMELLYREGEDYALRVVIPWAPTLLTYLDDLISEIRR